MTGTLFYLVGASGAGKDSLLVGLRQRLAAEHRCYVAHRYITRPAAAGGENHIALSEAEFSERLQHGSFAMHWHSNGLSYAIGSEVDLWLERGINVLVNGSRGWLSEALEQYENLVPVWVRVEPEMLRQRLETRGREDQTAIEARLARNTELEQAMPPGTLFVDNSGSLEQGVMQLLDIVAEQGWRQPLTQT